MHWIVEWILDSLFLVISRPTLSGHERKYRITKTGKIWRQIKENPIKDNKDFRYMVRFPFVLVLNNF